MSPSAAPVGVNRRSPFYCQLCGARGNVIESRYRWDRHGVPFTARRYQCPTCDYRWTTEERPGLQGLLGARKGGQRNVRGARYYLGFREPLDGPEDMVGPGRVYAMSQGGYWTPVYMRKAAHYHSPSGFNWGYGGSGPAELARHLLVHATGRRGLMERPDLYQAFKAEHIAPLGRLWMLEGDMIRRWVAEHERGDPVDVSQTEAEPATSDVPG